jgi:predicted nucleotidyltransferase
VDIDELKNEIILAFKSLNPEKIILFGSISRNDFDDESDIDLIIVYNTDKRFLERLKELYLKWDIPKAVDILAYTPDEFEKMTEESSFFKSVLRDGMIIYEST